jgi:hypothetical protein
MVFARVFLGSAVVAFSWGQGQADFRLFLLLEGCMLRCYQLLILSLILLARALILLAPFLSLNQF